VTRHPSAAAALGAPVARREVDLRRLNGIGRCQPGRPPELRASGSYSSAPADDQQLIPSLVRSRPALPLLVRSSRIVVTVIAARRTFTAQFVKCETGRPLRLAAPDAVQPLNAAALPARSPRLPSTRTSVRQPERVAPSGAPHLARRREP
jgi:hypothetical protein